MPQNFSINNNLSAEEEYFYQMWWILKEIRKRQLLRNNEKLIDFILKENDKIPPEIQLDFLNQLANKWRAIKIVGESFSLVLPNKENPDMDKYEHEIKLLIIEPNFKKFYEKCRKQIEKIEKNKISFFEKKNKKTVIYLTKNGDLYIPSNKTFCYQMEKGSNLYRVMQFFVENKIYNYYPTREIALELGYKSITNLRKDIGKINQRVKSKLHLKEKIIEGRKGSGYRINPKYKIVISR